MGDTVITIVAIFLAAVLMFVFPLMSISERTDDISQLKVQTATVEFVDNVRTTGKVTQENYDNFVQTISSTGNSYDVEIEIKVLDENPGKKTASANQTKIGENIYYSEYTSQVLEKMSKSPKGIIHLKDGDMFYVTVENTNTTISQMLKNFFYSISGNDTYKVAGQHAGVVMANGSEQ